RDSHCDFAAESKRANHGPSKETEAESEGKVDHHEKKEVESMNFTESVVEEAALDWLGGLGVWVAPGPAIVETERGGDFGRVVRAAGLRNVLARLNPKVPGSAVEEAFRKLTLPDSPSLPAANHAAPTARRGRAGNQRLTLTG